MDLTNRVLIIGVALLCVFVALVVILLAWSAPDESIARIEDLANTLSDQNTSSTKLIITFGGLIFVLLAVIVIIYEAAPPQTGSLKVVNIGSGEARIATDEVALRVEDEVRALPQVSSVNAIIMARGQKAEVSLDLHIAPDADLAVTAEEACRVARVVIEERMGVALTSPPQAQLHYRELRVAEPPSAPRAALPETQAPAARPPFENEPSTAPASPFAGESTHERSETASEDRPTGP